MTLNDIILTELCVVKSISRPTKAKMFRNCEVGDTLRIDVSLVCDEDKISQICITNARTHEFITVSARQLKRYSDILELAYTDYAYTAF